MPYPRCLTPAYFRSTLPHPTTTTPPPGIAIRQTFNANAESTLLVTGTFDALSAGILLYVTLCQLVTPQLTDSEWLRGSGVGMQGGPPAGGGGGGARAHIRGING